LQSPSQILENLQHESVSLNLKRRRKRRSVWWRQRRRNQILGEISAEVDRWNLRHGR
jgi:hypothetical protein